MMNTKKRWLAALLSVVMVVAMLPSMAFAGTPVTITGAAVDATGLVTWDTGDYNADNVYEAANYKVEIHSAKLGTGANDSDWSNVPAVTAAAVGTIKYDGAKASAKVDLTKVPSTGAQYKVKLIFDDSTYEGSVMLAIVGTAVDEPTAVDAITATLDADKAQLTIANASVKNPASKYEVKIYKNAKTNAAAINILPKDSVEVATVVLDGTNKASEVYDLDKTKFVYDATAKAVNNYFAVVTGTRADLKATTPYFTASKALSAPTKVATPTLAMADSSTAAKTKISEAATITATITANATDPQDVVFQLYNASNGSKVGKEIVKSVAAAGTTATANITDFTSQVTEPGFYFIAAIVKHVGSVDSDKATTATDELAVAKKVTTPTGVMTADGSVTITAGTAPVATGIEYVVLYKGNVVSKEQSGVLALGQAWTAVDMVSGTPKVVTDKKDKDYNIADFSLRVVGTNPGNVDSDSIIVTYGGALAAPTNVAWASSKVAPIATWTAVEGAESYDVVLTGVAVAGVAVKDITAVNVKGTSVDMSKFVPEGKTGALSFTVVAKAGTKQSVSVASLLPVFTINEKLVKATEVKWDGSKATWKAVDKATSYEVSKLVNGVQVGPTKTVTTTELTFKEMAKPGVYEFEVVAISGKDGVVASTPAKSDVKFIEGVSVGTIDWSKSSVSKSAARITWKAADNAQRYVVYKMNTKGDFVKKTIVKGTEYRDASLKSGKTYKYKVAAYSNAGGVKTWGEISKVKTVKTK